MKWYNTKIKRHRLLNCGLRVLALRQVRFGGIIHPGDWATYEGLICIETFSSRQLLLAALTCPPDWT